MPPSVAATLLQLVLTLLSAVQGANVPQSIRDNATLVVDSVITQVTATLSDPIFSISQVSAPEHIAASAAAGLVFGKSCTWNGQSVSSGSSVTAYQAASVASGSTCVSQQRTCLFGTLSGSYAYASCTVQADKACSFNGQTIPSGQSITAYQSSAVPYGSKCVSQQRLCTKGTLSGSYTSSLCSVGAAPNATTSITAYPNFNNACYAMVDGYTTVPGGGSTLYPNIAHLQGNCTATSSASPLLFSITQQNMEGSHASSTNFDPNISAYMSDYNSYAEDYGRWFNYGFIASSTGNSMAMSLDTVNYQEINVTGWPLQYGNLFFGMNDLSAKATLDKNIIVEFDMRLRGSQVRSDLYPQGLSGHRIMVGTSLQWPNASGNANTSYFYETDLEVTPSNYFDNYPFNYPLCTDRVYDLCWYDPAGVYSEGRFLSYANVVPGSSQLVDNSDVWVHIKIPLSQTIRSLPWVSQPTSWSQANLTGLYIGAESRGAAWYWFEIKNYQVYTQS